MNRALADLGFLLGIALGLVLLTPYYALKRLLR